MDKNQSKDANSMAVAQTNMVPGLTAQWHSDLAQIPPKEWDELAGAVQGGTPFLRHSLLSAMVNSGSACAATGWQVHFLTLSNTDGVIRAACPVFLKSHSHGEYVFDWAWADAHDNALAAQGHHYYPKLVSAVPYSPIPGQRLLVHPSLTMVEQAAARRHLLQALSDECQAKGWSSAHILFLSEEEAQASAAQGWLVRQGVQFHWQNRGPEPYVDFEDFLVGLHRTKRKNIQQERRKVREAGVTFEILEYEAITEADWDFFYLCYCQTYTERGQRPYLSRSFWAQGALALPGCWVLFVATQNGQRIAAALLAIDPVERIAYGRYWGAVADVSCLHFEACYYQPLDWCIKHGMRRFEGGAQGEHKLTRGLLPVNTYSAHWLRHEGLRHAVADFLMRETQGVRRYIDELDERSPFKPPDQSA